MPVAYPIGMPAPLRSGRSRRQPAAFRMPMPRRGNGYAQAIGTEPPVFWDLTWRLAGAQAQVFRQWFDTFLQRGLLEATIPLRTEFGLLNHTCLFMPDSLMETRQLGGLWEYSARVMARAQIIPGTAPSSSGLTTAYPLALPTILRTTKRRRRDASFSMSDAEEGYAYVQASGTDVPVVWDIELRFTPAEAALFQVWFRDLLGMGVLPFTIPIETEYGLITHQVQFLPGGLLDTREDGESYTYRASIAARSLIVPVDDTADNDVLVLTMAGADNGTVFTDLSPSAHTMTVSGNAKTSTAFSVFGGSGAASLALDGTGDWIQTTTALGDFQFGTADFTVECFFRTTDAKPQAILDYYQTANTGSWQLFLDAPAAYGAATLGWWSSNALGVRIVNGITNPRDGAFHHAEVCRVAGVTRLFLDGKLEGAAADTRNYNASLPRMTIGAQVTTRNASYDMAGHVGAVRIKKGVGLHTADFVPPQLPFG